MGFNRYTVNKYKHKLMEECNARNRLELLYIMSDIKNRQIIFKATQRDMEILSLLVTGNTYNEICKKLNIKFRTVREHITNLISKNTCQNIEELILIYSSWKKQNAENSTF